MQTSLHFASVQKKKVTLGGDEQINIVTCREQTYKLLCLAVITET